MSEEDVCKTHSLGGSRCTLPIGHEGKHLDSHGWEWDTASQLRLAKDWGY